MAAYYNEIDPYAAQWLRNLIEAGHIAPGIVDERDIREVQPDELKEFSQCHFFAGIGVWSYALRRAGWPDDRPVWTGSCPCQPFSNAGSKAGFADERHLWPHWFHLITQCTPEVVFGEQVASKDGLAWLDLVSSDLERAGYANAAADLCAAGVGAPHIRQRLWFVAERLDNAASARHVGALEDAEGNSRHEARLRVSGKGRGPCGVADTDSNGKDGKPFDNGKANEVPSRQCEPEDDSDVPERSRRNYSRWRPGRVDGLQSDGPRPSPTNGFWRDVDWLFCRDGKWRPVRPGSFPLVDGAANRVGRLRAYGNAINAEAAEVFIGASMECLLCES